MSAPVIESVTPAANQADVVLGQPIEVLFDQPIDPASLSSQTFSLTGPGQSSLVDAENLIRKDGLLHTGREYITGAFVFPAPAAGDAWVQDQKLVFTPSRPLRPNVTYTVLLVGQGSLLAKSYVRNPAGEGMPASVQYTFKTGELNLSAPPLQSPLRPLNPWEKPRLDPSSILVRPRKAIGNDLTQEIELVFPGEIDPASFNPDDILVAGEPFLNDPGTSIPDSTATIVIDGNRLLITVHWGATPVEVAGLTYPPPGASGPVPDASDFGWMAPENGGVRPA